MNLILCGLPASGKTSFGKRVGEKLNRPFIDTDDRVISTYYARVQKKSTCRDIVLREGILFFQSLEKEVIKELQGVQNSIIALGGNTLSTIENVHLLSSIGRIIYLKVPFPIVLDRLVKKKPFPSYLDERDIEGSFQELLKKRLPLYENHSHYTVDI